jgi:hypothetical protein
MSGDSVRDVRKHPKNDDACNGAAVAKFAIAGQSSSFSR